MAFSNDDIQYRGELRSRINTLSAPERERFLQPYLPAPRLRKSNSGRSTRRQNSQPIRTFVKSKIFYLVYFIIHIFFSIYIRIRQSYRAVVDRILSILYYHHRTPELIRKDVRGLSQLPEHLSVALTLRKDDDALEMLMDEVAELAAWSSCAGIPVLSVYERSGVLKSCIPAVHEAIISKFSSYYGPPSQQPDLGVFAPHHPLYSPTLAPKSTKSNNEAITILLISYADGRETLVDLTKTLAEMAQHGKVSPQDISTKLIDAEIGEMMTTPTSPPPETENENENENENVDPSGNTSGNEGRGEAAHSQAVFSKADPDLLLVFGPYVKLDGYPPWQIRLTEVSSTGDNSSSITGGSEAVEYQRFLRGLWRYAKAEMRFGR